MTEDPDPLHSEDKIALWFTGILYAAVAVSWLVNYHVSTSAYWIAGSVWAGLVLDAFHAKHKRTERLLREIKEQLDRLGAQR